MLPVILRSLAEVSPSTLIVPEKVEVPGGFTTKLLVDSIL
ncbi:hypothetical protein CPC698_0869 [Chlamydia psittaci C6/98]|nr:hypothetical protein CP02DC24_0257 [Chlamydia psittaci 02DC24]EPP33383.1 hypothetical protein CPC698_0869 [Chlamydia psittaci C6/98]